MQFVFGRKGTSEMTPIYLERNKSGSRRRHEKARARILTKTLSVLPQAKNKLLNKHIKTFTSLSAEGKNPHFRDK